MVAALTREIDLTPIFPGASNEDQIETIYFGGGTPSLLDIQDAEIIFDALKSKFLISPDAEITLEANPDDINPEKLSQWKKIGINRLSVGIQSFLEEELVWMNRAHTAKESMQCIDEIIEAGFTNFSIDLIYGSPLLSNEAWEKNIATVIEKKIPHISCYALTVEPKTALHKMIDLHKKENVDPEKQAQQFILLMERMQQAGYEHYEISNFAKSGMRSRHNSSYWQGKKYYGLGPSAHSYDGKSRRWNIANNALYIQSLQNDVIPFTEEILTPVQQLNEYIMTSLRTTEGLDLTIVKNRFGEKYSIDLERAAGKWITGQKVLSENSTLILTREGKLFADGIAADLFF